MVFIPSFSVTLFLSVIHHLYFLPSCFILSVSFLLAYILPLILSVSFTLSTYISLYSFLSPSQPSSVYLSIHLCLLLWLTCLCVSCLLWNPPLCHILFSSSYPVLIQLLPPTPFHSRVTLLEETDEQWLLSDRLFWADCGGKHGEVMEVNVWSFDWVVHKQWPKVFWRAVIKSGVFIRKLTKKQCKFVSALLSKMWTIS